MMGLHTIVECAIHKARAQTAPVQEHLCVFGIDVSFQETSDAFLRVQRGGHCDRFLMGALQREAKLQQRGSEKPWNILKMTVPKHLV